MRKLSEIELDTDRLPTVDEKIQLSHDIFKIGNAELARVLTMIETNCPYAIARKSSTEEILINFDALPAKVFHEVNSFVVNSLLNFSGNKRGKKRKNENGKD